MGFAASAGGDIWRPRTEPLQRSLAANVLHRNFKATRPNQKWAGDMTYIATGEGWLYLAVLMDLLFSPRRGLGNGGAASRRS